MSEQEKLSRRIALHFEPWEFLPNPQECSSGPSRLGFWRNTVIHTMPIEMKWQPRSIDEPEIAMRLLKALLAKGIEVKLSMDHLGDKCVKLGMEGEGIDPFKKWPTHEEPTLELVTAYAFATANGIEEA